MSKSKRWVNIATYVTLAAAATIALTLPDGAGIEATVAEPVSLDPVQIELVMLVDVSGSVNSSEYVLQRDGYADAFRDESLTSSIATRGGVAVLYVEWSGDDEQAIRIPWTRLDTAADCIAYADAIAGLSRAYSGSTIMSEAIVFAADEMASNSYQGLRRIIDVSGDGKCKNWDFYEHGDDDSSSSGGGGSVGGTRWDDMRSYIVGKVDQINAICITTSNDVRTFYENEVPYGTGAFAMQVDTFAEFAGHILSKLVREVGSVPQIYD